MPFDIQYNKYERNLNRVLVIQVPAMMFEMCVVQSPYREIDTTICTTNKERQK